MASQFIHLLILATISCIGSAAWPQELPQQHKQQDVLRLSGMREKMILRSIGPFELSDADSNSMIQFQFAGQLRTVFKSHDQGPFESRTHEMFMEA